jgi:hypothetical protein
MNEEIEEIIYAVVGFETSGGEMGMSTSEAIKKLYNLVSQAKIESFKEGYIKGGINQKDGTFFVEDSNL